MPDDAQGDGKQREQPGGMTQREQAIDEALESLYGDGDDGSLDDANPDIARWLGDIRNYFPASVVQIMQRDAIEKLNLRKLLSDPDLLQHVEPDLDLVTQLLALNKRLPAQTRETARQIVREVVEELRKQLQFPLEQAVRGTLQRAIRTRRPRHHDINWQRTIYANLKHYQPDQRTIIPEQLIGFGRQRSALRDVILCVDQSGSMAQSVVYASIFASVMASLPALNTRIVAFAAQVADLSDHLDDPVELLFGSQLRGGTNIDRALTYCQQLITRPSDTTLVLITDLYEGSKKENMVRRVGELVASGVQVIVLLALNDKGAPRFNRAIANQLVAFDVPAFACTPQQFPDLMGAILNKRDIRQWAASHNIVTAPSN